MKLQDVMSWGVKSMGASEIQTPHIDVLVLLSYLLGKDKDYLYANSSIELSSDILGQFLNTIKKRAEHYPLAYITGKKEFMSLDFAVNEHVMIPRPETEILVEETLKLFPPDEACSRMILDIGTGCGNIALSLAKYNEHIKVYATDISSNAIDIASENREKLSMSDSVSFVNCSLWDCFKDNKWKGRFDALVSNPPYVRTGQLNDLTAEVLYEPREALDGGVDGISLYSSLVSGGKFLLGKGGYLILEIGEGQAKAVSNIVKKARTFEKVFVKKDYAGIDRVIIARRK